MRSVDFCYEKYHRKTYKPNIETECEKNISHAYFQLYQ